MREVFQTEVIRIARDYQSETYEVGDVVTIRSWDDMASEFGVGSNSQYIRMPGYVFNRGMEKFCGQSFRILRKTAFENAYRLSRMDGNEIPCIYTPEMFEPPEITVFDGFESMLTEVL